MSSLGHEALNSPFAVQSLLACRVPITSILGCILRQYRKVGYNKLRYPLASATRKLQQPIAPATLKLQSPNAEKQRSPKALAFRFRALNPQCHLMKPQTRNPKFLKALKPVRLLGYVELGLMGEEQHLAWFMERFRV